MTLDEAKKPPACGHWEARTGCHNCKERTRALLPEFPLQVDRNYDRPGPIAIPWSVAEMAWGMYAQKYGTQQSVERMAQRGGFAWSEMDDLYPEWRTETMELLKLRAELADIKDSFRRTVNEPCAPDEVHCSCVPALREKVKNLEDDLAHEKGGRIDEAAIREHLSSLGLPSYGPILNAVKEALVAMSRRKDGPPVPDTTFDLFFELMDAGKLQTECGHDAEPDFCDGCAAERERKQRDVWVKIRNWLKANGRG